MDDSIQPSRQELSALHDSTYRWALACCGFDEDLAREVMQTVYLDIMRRRAVFHGRASLKTWLFAVVKRTSLRLAGSIRRSNELRERLRRLETVEPVGDPCEDHLHRSRQHREVSKALATLSAQQRQLVELVYYHELTIRESAAVMGVGLGTARQHFHRAKIALARELQPLQEQESTNHV